MEHLCMGCMEPLLEGLDVCPCCGYRVGTPPEEAFHLMPGTLLENRYIIGRVIGFGGFGVTYLGYDTLLKMKVAVKEYLPGDFSTRMPRQQKLTIFSGDKKEQFMAGKDKFIDEARRLAKFQNTPEVVHVFDCFEANDTAYIIMEYLEGMSLKEKLEKEGPMSLQQALPILLDVLHGLEAVHAEGIMHRDIAPDNIFITNDQQVKLIDFGASRFATTTHSRSLTVLIKQGYSPEEQYRSRGDQGTWTDVYAAAATFYKMITGKTPQDAMQRAGKDQLKPPSKLGVKIGPNMENALMNALNVKVDERTQTAKQFEDELMANVVKRVAVKKQQVDIGRFPLWIKITAVVVALGIALFAGLTAAGVIRFDIMGWSGGAVPDGKTRVPNVINQEMEEAISRGEAANLSVYVYDKQYSSEIAANRVLSQTIRGGTLANVNDRLGIVISAGIEPTTVPDVLGMESETAIQTLKNAGFVVNSKEEEYRAAPGTVGFQSLEPDSSAQTGTEIELIISKGMPGADSSRDETVDDFTGMSFEQAAEQSAAKYLYVLKGKVQYSDTVAEGVIMGQDTAAGTVLKQNSNIIVTVSLGREKAQVPDLQYKTEEEARSLLETAGLTADIRQETSNTVAEGNVIRQDVAAGEMVDKGSAVVVYVSSGAARTTNTPAGNQNTGTAGGQNNGGANQAPAAGTNQPAVQETAAPPQAEPSAGAASTIWDVIGN